MERHTTPLRCFTQNIVPTPTVESSIRGVPKCMAEIETVNLAAYHEARWRFRDHSRTLPGGWIILTVTDGSEWWRFECKSVGDNMYCISGSEWRRFFGRTGINARVTLCSKADDENFHRIHVKMSEA